MPPAEVTEEGIPALATGQQLKLRVRGPCPGIVDQGPLAHAAAAMIGESTQGQRQLPLGCLREGVKGHVARVLMRGSAPGRLPAREKERFQLLGHGGGKTAVNGVGPPPKKHPSPP